MALGKIWVFAEIAGGKPAPVALELLTKARSLAGTVEAVAFAPDAADAATELGAHGATTLYAGTDPLWGELLLGGPAADALAALMRGAQTRSGALRDDLQLPRRRRPAGREARRAGDRQRPRRERRRRHLGALVGLRSHPQRRDALRGRRPGDRDHPAQVVRGRAERRRLPPRSPRSPRRSTRSTRRPG